MVDTGEASGAANDPDFFACDPNNAFVYKRILRLMVAPAEEIGSQMQALGLDPQAVRWVVQTHLHSDHADGMDSFPNAEFILPRGDYPASMGAVPCLWPKWLKPAFPAYKRERYFRFERQFQLTTAGDLLIVPTPGHSPDHQSVILIDDDRDYFLAGDSSFDLAQMQQGIVAGIVANVADARRTLHTIKAHCAERPTVYLPSHDEESGRRLLEKRVVELPLANDHRHTALLRHRHRRNLIDKGLMIHRIFHA